ncbi:MAG: glucose-6-phosphate dehydrogenase assembly protein OpcA [Candidatus Sumerlaeia bacterium]|nr:glucose-6-phosphate dehydrogenase assembly protein OpcA [Candidatus Sumerlaeia bacterium]
MAPDSFTVSLTGNEVSLSPEEIERELSSMWKPLDEAEGASIARMVLANVIWLGSSADLPRAQRIIQKVVPRYPCRLFLLEFNEKEEGTTPRANVSAQCFRPRVGEVPVCCELIHLTFGPKSARHIRGSVSPLLLGDIQTILWLSLADENFSHLGDLQGMVDRTIAMEMRSPSPAEHLRRCVSGEHPTFDLSWFRIMPLREQIAAFFDDSANNFDLQGIKSVRLTVTSQCTFPQLPLFVAGLLTGWFGSRLGWVPKGGNIKGYRYEAGDRVLTVSLAECDEKVSKGLSGFRGLEMEDTEGRVFHLTLSPEDSQLTLRILRDDVVEASRITNVREMRGWESLGRALNAPPPAQYFRRAANLAIPLLEHYCP